MSDVTIRVSGVGASQEVTVEAGSTLEDLDLDNEAQGTDVRVNGESVSPDYQVQPGDQVTQTPANAKLGA
jgi:hypothetical protein